MSKAPEDSHRRPANLPGTWRRWWAALKPASWPKLLVPTIFGQSLGVVAAGAVSWRAVLVGLVFVLCLLAFIVLLNDWGDRGVDAIKRRMFPDGCSPKTIPDGLLPAHQLLLAGLAAGLLGLLVAALGGWWLGQPRLPWIGTLGLAIFVAYTFPPLKLNYRGGGELLEGLGIGAVLPWFNVHAQCGALWHPALALLPGCVLLGLASALASGLADEESDRAGGKRTCVTIFGNGPSRWLAQGCLALGAAAWLVASLVAPRVVPWWAVLAGVAVVTWHGHKGRRLGPLALTNAFAAQGRYKQQLHHAIWRGHLVLAALLVTAALHW